MDTLLQKELVEAGLRLQRLLARVVTESPECLPDNAGKWSVEFRNLSTGEGITVIYSGNLHPMHSKHSN